MQGETGQSVVPASLRALLAGVVDYAGLFPPASLDMAATVRNYASYLASEHAWMLGRLIVPAPRLAEFDAAAKGLLPVGEAPAWRLSALLGDDLEADLETVAAFNDAHASGETVDALVDAVELKAGSIARIEEAIELVPDEIYPFVEIPSAGDPRGLIAALAGSEAGAKIRTGGVTADAFPTAQDIARFIVACRQAGVCFKATAGLHHPRRGPYRLTYAPDAPTGVMHGFLNVFVAGAAAFSGEESVDRLAQLLESDASRMEFVEQGVSAGGRRIATEQVERARRDFAMSFGSCSFEEPVEDLRSMGLLEVRRAPA
jgi:hypothetical protein